MIVLSLFIIGHMGLFFYTLKGSIISAAGVPTTDIIEPKFDMGLVLNGMIQGDIFVFHSDE